MPIIKEERLGHECWVPMFGANLRTIRWAGGTTWYCKKCSAKWVVYYDRYDYRHWQRDGYHTPEDGQ